MNQMKKLSNKKGFTLIEMLIVVAIIALLAAITIPTISGATDKAEKAATEAKEHNQELKDAIEELDIDGVTVDLGDDGE